MGRRGEVGSVCLCGKRRNFLSLFNGDWERKVIVAENNGLSRESHSCP